MKHLFQTYLRCILSVLLLCVTWSLWADVTAPADPQPQALPIMRLSYDASAFNTKTYTPATLVFESADTTRSYICAVRHRGATSLSYDKPNFALKFYHEDGTSDDVRFLGMRKDNNWVLDAMASDFGKIRNRVSMDLWLESSRKPYHQEQEPNAINGYRGEYVEVYVNDEYYGLYCLNEKVDRKQLKLKKYKEAKDTVGEDGTPKVIPAYYRGLLYKAVNGKSTRMPYLLYPPTDPNESSAKYDGMEAAYPDVQEGEPWSWTPLREDIYFLAAKTSTTFNNQIGQHFDVPVFIDYVLFLDLLYANDNVGKNVYFWYYDQTEPKPRVGVTPWDLDTSWGRNYMGGRVAANQDLANKSNFHTRFTRWYRGYADTLAVRYAELRDTYWQETAICNHFGRYFDLFRATGAWDREVARWGNSNCKTRGLDEEQEYINTWVHDRLAFLDSIYNYVPKEIIPEEPEEPEQPDTPDTPDNPGEEPEEPETPDNPETPDTPDTPDNPGEEPETPDTPDTPDNPGEEPEQPETPENPEESAAISTISSDSQTSSFGYDLTGRRVSAQDHGLIFWQGSLIWRQE